MVVKSNWVATTTDQCGHMHPCNSWPSPSWIPYAIDFSIRGALRLPNINLTSSYDTCALKAFWIRQPLYDKQKYGIIISPCVSLVPRFHCILFMVTVVLRLWIHRLAVYHTPYSTVKTHTVMWFSPKVINTSLLSLSLFNYQTGQFCFECSSLL